MSDSLETILRAEREWDIVFCPTVNGWPVDRIQADDIESPRLNMVLLFYWKINVLLNELKRAEDDALGELNARFSNHLDKKGNLDRELVRYGAFVDQELDGGKVCDVLYTCPRGIWNPEVCRYETRELALTDPAFDE